ncbi:MAG: glycerol-3-phosphate dehydrogenase/oxidase [Bacteroidetes bacterium]|nr:glycerol-3-phosphate dehydrogenase/oxidase [Bacteroidota bacterium]
MRSFSALNRLKLLEESGKQHFDLIIIGGGITGAGVALDAAAAGYRVFLCEANDFASGTSSKSTKLIHGGLRYLKNLQFGVVRKTGIEREVLYRNAMHLVRPEPMLLPVIRKGELGMFSTRIALWMYEFLAGVKKDMRFKMLNKESALMEEPLLHKDNLLGAALYTEYRTDDSRLTISVIKKAVELGAVCVNYSPCKGFVKNNSSKIEGIHVIDAFTQKSFTVKGRFIINAAGPWVDDVRHLDDNNLNKNLVLSKGVHLVFPHFKLPVKQSAYFDAPGGRMVFAIPRGNKTYVGTTDTLFSGNPGTAGITRSDLNYLIEACNNMFPDIALRADDLLSSWTGLRPLIAKQGKGTTELSRKDEIFISPGGLISIAGGKLTGYRHMAENVMKKLHQKGLKKKSKAIASRHLKLSGAEFNNEQEIAEFIEQQIGEAKQIGAGEKMIISWVERYGRNTSKIVEIAYELWPQIVEKELVPLFAEINYAIHSEMVCTPLDFWERRTGKLYFNFDKLAEEFELSYPFFCQQLNLNERLITELKYKFYAAMDAVKPSE